ncbi:hypothetical protein HZC53_04345 [Candidatus Uhrbacteria bacterium]|nr:hypothetical protein [Candidatus Uhrbacteria bacterium]
MRFDTAELIRVMSTSAIWVFGGLPTRQVEKIHFDAQEFLETQPFWREYRLVTMDDIEPESEFLEVSVDVQRGKWLAWALMHFCKPPIVDSALRGKEVHYRYFSGLGHTTAHIPLKKILARKFEVDWHAAIYVVRKRDDASDNQGSQP